MEKNHYDKVVFFYDRLAFLLLGKGYRQSKWAFLDEIRPGNLVLYIGGGSGENLALIQQRVGGNGRVFYVEASRKMIDKAQRKLKNQESENVEFLHLSEFEQLPLLEFDFIITQYFLDILTDSEINGLFSEMENRIHKESKWLLVDFFNKEKRWWLQFLMIAFFRILTKHPRKNLPEYLPFFEKYNWGKQNEERFKGDWIKAIVFRKAS